ncbi:MAG TPA: hypothetical protein VNE00_12435 [Paraburkholderia sp.]|nr:hypothetical protein [Paraburkholderia sp.]
MRAEPLLTRTGVAARAVVPGFAPRCAALPDSGASCAGKPPGRFDARACECDSPEPAGLASCKDEPRAGDVELSFMDEKSLKNPRPRGHPNDSDTCALLMDRIDGRGSSVTGEAPVAIDVDGSLISGFLA